MENIVFKYHEMPHAYLMDNPNANSLREQLSQSQLDTNVATCNLKELELIFFSKENINCINKQLIIHIYNITDKQFKIKQQSTETLLIVMRYIYNTYAKYLPYDIPKQIIELNKLLIDDVTPGIITNITQKIEYLNYIDKRPPLLDLPVSTNKRKVLLPYL